jgi:hypothetical protein
MHTDDGHSASDSCQAASWTAIIVLRPTAAAAAACHGAAMTGTVPVTRRAPCQRGTVSGWPGHWQLSLSDNLN